MVCTIRITFYLKREVIVVRDEHACAYSSPNGKIVSYTGMLNWLKTDEEITSRRPLTWYQVIQMNDQQPCLVLMQALEQDPTDAMQLRNPNYDRSSWHLQMTEAGA